MNIKKGDLVCWASWNNRVYVVVKMKDEDIRFTYIKLYDPYSNRFHHIGVALKKECFEVLR